MVRLTCLTLTPRAWILVLALALSLLLIYTYIFMSIEVMYYTYKLQTTDTATSRPHCPKHFMPQESISYIHYNPSYVLYIPGLRSDQISRWSTHSPRQPLRLHWQRKSVNHELEHQCIIYSVIKLSNLSSLGYSFQYSNCTAIISNKISSQKILNKPEWIWEWQACARYQRCTIYHASHKQVKGIRYLPAKTVRDPTKWKRDFKEKRKEKPLKQTTALP